MDGSGNVIVTGYFKQPVDFGTGPLTAAGTYLGDVFVAKYSASGAPLWVKQVGSSGFDKGTAIAVDGASNVLVTGYFNGTVNFGLGTVTSAGGPDVFVVKYTPQGAPLWAKRFGGSGFDVAHGIGVDGGGNVAVTGEFQNTADFGTGLLTSAGGRDIFLAEYSPDGAPLWSRSFGGTSEDGATSVALDGSGNGIVTGSFTGAVDVGCGLLPDLGGRAGPTASSGRTRRERGARRAAHAAARHASALTQVIEPRPDGWSSSVVRRISSRFRSDEAHASPISRLRIRRHAAPKTRPL